MSRKYYFSWAPEEQSFKDAWPQILIDAGLIVAIAENNHSISIKGPHGGGYADIGPERIALNGDASHELSCESFIIDAEPWDRWAEHKKKTREPHHQQARYAKLGYMADSCKTLELPYGTVVGAILIRMAQLAPEAVACYAWQSWEEAWADSRGLVQEIFGANVTEYPAGERKVPACVEAKAA